MYLRSRWEYCCVEVERETGQGGDVFTFEMIIC